MYHYSISVFRLDSLVLNLPIIWNVGIKADLRSISTGSWGIEAQLATIDLFTNSFQPFQINGGTLAKSSSLERGNIRQYSREFYY